MNGGETNVLEDKWTDINANRKIGEDLWTGKTEFTIDDKTGTFGIYSKQLEGDRKGSTFLSKSFRMSLNLNLGQIIRYTIQFRV